VPDPYNPQSLNRYSYCLNNPLIYTDPSGHEQKLTPEIFAALQELWYSLNGLGNNYNNAYEFGASISSGLWNLIFTGSSGLDLFNSGFEGLNAWMSVKAVYSGSGGNDNPITPSNYDPNNSDPNYRERVIRDVIKQFGINTQGANIHYDRSRNYSIGEAEGKFIRENIYDLKAGDILIGKNAFKSLGWLGSTIGHELGHFTNWQNGWSYKEDSYRGEAAIYKWQLKLNTQAYFGLTSDEAQELQRRFDKNYSKYFQPGDEHLYDGIIPINGR